MTRTLPPEPVASEPQPIPTDAPAPRGDNLGDLEALLEVALDPETLKNHPEGVAIQRLATQINMIMKNNRIPEGEKQRILEELVPRLIELLEAGLGGNL